MELKEKSTISELRSLLGKDCKHRTLRGWVLAGTVVAVELRDDNIYLIVKDGVRRNHEQHLRLDKCRIDDAPQESKEIPQSKRVADKIKKVMEAKKRQDFVDAPPQPLGFEE